MEQINIVTAIEEMVDKGFSCSKIAQDLVISRNTVRRIAKDLGIDFQERYQNKRFVYLVMECNFCHGIFIVKENTKNSKKKFCGLNCFIRKQREVMIRDNSPRYTNHRKRYCRSHTYVKDGGNKSFLKHRKIMENKLQRKLKDNECVHHLDGNAQNNSLDNLQIISRSDHSRLTAKKMWNKMKGEIQPIIVRKVYMTLQKPH